MGVYVDHAKHGYGRLVMSHMIADTPDELRVIAVTIGLRLSWFQAGASCPHFDVAQSKRALAIRAGAIALRRAPYVLVMRRIKETWPRDPAGRWLLGEIDGHQEQPRKV